MQRGLGPKTWGGGGGRLSHITRIYSIISHVIWEWTKIRKGIHTYIHACMYAYIHIHTHTHIYIYIYIYIFKEIWRPCLSDKWYGFIKNTSACNKRTDRRFASEGFFDGIINNNAIDLFHKWRLLHGNEARMLFSQSILVSNYQTDMISFLAFFLLSIRVSF